MLDAAYSIPSGGEEVTSNWDYSEELDLYDVPSTDGPDSPGDGVRTSARGCPKYNLAALVDEFPRLNEPVVDGLFRQGETVNIIADPKVGKSWLSYGLALSIASGQDWLDRYRVSRGKVLLIDNELHPETIASRIPSVAQAMGLNWRDIAPNVDIWPLRGNLRDLFRMKADFESIEPGEYALIIIDAWYRMIPGSQSENDNAQMAMLYNQLDRYAAHTEAAIACIHHASKGGQAAKRTTDVGAGAGAQSRAADCHLVLREHEDGGAAVLDAAVRSFKPVEPAVLRWKFPLWRVDGAADPSALKGRKTPREERQQESDLESQGEVLDALASPATNGSIRTATGFGRERANRAIARLRKDGFIEACKVAVNGRDYDGWRKTLKARDT